MANNISLIVATDENNGIGLNNKLLCHLPDDLQYFKKITSGHTIVMGRKTYESIGNPLPNRRNMIMSRNEDFNVNNCETIHSIPDLLKFIPSTEEVFVIGGESIFTQTITYASKIYLTYINYKFQADSFFPIINTNKDWKLAKTIKHDIDEKHKYSFSYLIYERRKKKNSVKHTNVEQHLLSL